MKKKKHPFYHRMKNVGNKLSKMFFDNTDGYSGDEMSVDDTIKYDFYFYYFGENEKRYISLCKEFIKDFIEFELHLDSFYLNLDLSVEQFEKLEQKLEIEESSKKYNL